MVKPRVEMHRHAFNYREENEMDKLEQVTEQLEAESKSRILTELLHEDELEAESKASHPIAALPAICGCDTDTPAA